MNAVKSAARQAVLSSRSPLDKSTYLAKAQQLLRPGHQNHIYDYLSPTNSHLLNTTLAGLVPPEVHYPAELRDHYTALKRDAPFPNSIVQEASLPVGHHLVYFPPQTPSTNLLPDGTEPDHCPGAPFTRRMWAGGRVRFPNSGGAWGGMTRKSLMLDGYLNVCLEKVTKEPEIKGPEGNEKVFVEISRKYGRTRPPWQPTTTEDSVFVETYPDIDETRTLVFMRERDADERIETAGKSRTENMRDMTRLKALKDKNMAPTYSFSLTPDRKLLFHFSALTYNAHAIHLDQRYAQEVEGHKDLLVHGPLSLSLMLMAVRAQADKLKTDEGIDLSLTELNYRNLAPLYVDEEMKICVRMRTDTHTDTEPTWDVWVEGPDGGFAVKGTATMQSIG